MDFTLLVTVVSLLLEREGRLSYRYLARQLALDPSELDDLRHELIGRRIAVDDDETFLVWAGSPAPTAASALPPAPAAAQPTAQATEPAPQAPEPAPPPPEPRSHGSAAAGDAERRQLTVMFVDLVGSTALAAGMDPEELRDVITAFQDRCRSAITQYDGFIARYMGDGLLVYFGYPQAHEDDAARATRAGLDIIGAMPALNADLGGLGAVALSVRVGIATGRVVVGDLVGEGAAEEAAVIGETPNLAARLQGLAEPNQLVISGATRRLLGEQFELRDLGTHELKGIAEPMAAWGVGAETGADRDTGTRHGGRDVPLVGRQAELGLLRRAWETGREGHGQVVLIQGEAGVGKTRLLDALRQELAGRDFTWLSIRCSPYFAKSTLHPVIEQLRRAFGWQPEDDDARRLEKLEAVLATQSAPLEEVVPLYAELMSLPLAPDRYPPLGLSPQLRREATLDAICAWLLELAETGPLLQVCEDLHWADPTTLELLRLYIEQSPTAPVLTVMTFRPEFEPPWPVRSHVTPITLARLEPPEVRALAAHLAGPLTLPPEVIAHVMSKADGVPLYVEEITKAVLESGVLIAEDGRYVLAGALEEMQIPSTLQDSLMARLDLAPRRREVAQLAAVLGREFAYQMLSLLVELEDDELQRALGELVADELLYQRGRPPRSRYTFKHALIQDAAYRSLLTRTRQRYHGNVAALLESRFPEVAAANPDVVARHLTEAGDAERAIEQWHRAGRLALDRYANVEAASHFEAGLSLIGELPKGERRNQREVALQLGLGTARIVNYGLGDPESGAAFERALELSHTLGDSEQRVSAQLGLTRFYAMRAAFETTRGLAADLLRFAEREGDDVMRVVGHYQLGFVYALRAEFEAAATHLDAALEIYDPAQDRSAAFRNGQHPAVACGMYRSWVLWLEGYPDRALERASASLELARSLEHPYTLAHAYISAAWLHQLRREPLETLRMSELAVSLSAERGMDMWLAVGTCFKTWAGRALGSEESTAALGDSLAAWSASGVLIMVPHLNYLLAETHLAEGRHREALQAIEHALAVAGESGERFTLAELHRLRGVILDALDDDGAESELASAVSIAHQQGARSFEIRAATSLARHWRRAGRHQHARELLVPIYEQFTEGHDTPDLSETRSIIEEPGAEPSSLARGA